MTSIAVRRGSWLPPLVALCVGLLAAMLLADGSANREVPAATATPRLASAPAAPRLSRVASLPAALRRPRAQRAPERVATAPVVVATPTPTPTATPTSTPAPVPSPVATVPAAPAEPPAPVATPAPTFDDSGSGPDFGGADSPP
jgi:hypothetical protein